MDIRAVRDRIRLGESIYDIPLRVTFYARVSTEKDAQMNSLSNQVKHFEHYIKEIKAWTFVPGYVDEGLSGGSTRKRENFNLMIEDARQGLFDLIITKEISRFSRNTLDSIHYTQDLLNMGVPIIFQSDGINTLETDSEFRLVIMAAVAQDEIRKLSERLKFGFRQSIKDGHVLGNSRMYGYDKKNCQLTVNEEQAEIVSLIFHLYVHEKMGFRKIAQYLTDEKGARSYQGTPFNVKTVQNIITNPKYKGYYCANKTKSIDYKEHKNIFLDKSEWILYKDDSIPALVSEELWEEANQMLKQKSGALRQSGAEYHNRYAYSGKIKCAEHGTSYHRHAFKTKTGETEFWCCKEHKQRGADYCSAPQLRTSELDEIMANIFSQLLNGKEQLIHDTLSLIQHTSEEKDRSVEIAALAQEAEAITGKKDKLLDLAMEGLVSNEEFRQRNERFNEQARQVKARITQLQLEHGKCDAKLDSLNQIRSALEHELSFQGGINSNLVSCILDQIVVHNTEGTHCIKMDIHLKMGEMLEYQYLRRLPLRCKSF